VVVVTIGVGDVVVVTIGVGDVVVVTIGVGDVVVVTIGVIGVVIVTVGDDVVAVVAAVVSAGLLHQSHTISQVKPPNTLGSPAKFFNTSRVSVIVGDSPSILPSTSRAA